MAQISRPFQVAFVALVLFAGVWFLALNGHSSSNSSGPPASAPSSPSSHSVYHGSAPGVEGLTKAITKAHGAVTTSQQNAKALEEKSAQAASAAPGTSSSAASAPAGSGAASARHGSSATSPRSSSSSSTRSAPRATAPGAPTRQASVEKVLKAGQIAVILFWNPKATDDAAVREQLQILEAAHHQIRKYANNRSVRTLLRLTGVELQKRFATFEASAREVSAFGTITRGVQVNLTPTMLVVNPHGIVRTITGFTDAYSIEQSIDEARHAKG